VVGVPSPRQELIVRLAMQEHFRKLRNDPIWAVRVERLRSKLRVSRDKMSALRADPQFSAVATTLKQHRI